MKLKQAAALTAWMIVMTGTVLTAKAEEYHGLKYAVSEDGTVAITGCDKTLTSVEIPAEIDGMAVTNIEKQAFNGCTGLTEIMIPDSVTNIAFCAFYGCTGLTDITLPDSITNIDAQAFHGCTGLTSITIPDSVTSIKWHTFSGCTSLADITLPDSVTVLDSTAFEDTAWYHAQPDGIVYLENWLYMYKGDMPDNTSVTMNNGITRIADSAFSGYSGLTSILLPDGVKSIGSNAFSYCTELTEITIPDSVTNIENWAFYGCAGLTDLTILNPECEIFDYSSIIPETTAIHGYENSTAQAFAEKYHRTFVSLGEAPGVLPLYGDANDDGEVTIVDVVKLCRCAMGADTMTQTGAMNADVDGNGTADATDASYIIQSLVGLVTLPVADRR